MWVEIWYNEGMCGMTHFYTLNGISLTIRGNDKHRGLRKESRDKLRRGRTNDVPHPTADGVRLSQEVNFKFFY